MRFRSLDSLRGLAALAVVFDHCCWAFAGYLRAPLNPFHADFWASPLPALRWTPLHIMCNGGTAVLLFFVLSGFVLTLSIEGHFSYGAYAIKRICRIYLPFAFAILAAAVLCALVAPVPIPALSKWFNSSSWNQPLTAGLVVGHLLMSGIPGFQSLDNPVWSLVHEIRISLLLPGLVWLLKRWPARTLIATIVAAVPAEVLALHSSNIVSSLASTVLYIHMFAAGALLALHREKVREHILGLSPMAHFGLWTMVLFLMWFPSGNWTIFLYAGLGSAGLVALCFSDARAVAHLTGPIPIWLGKVSYSLYLVHLPILLAIFHSFYGHAPAAVLVIATITLALIASELVNRFVERPSMRLAKFLADRFQRSEKTEVLVA